MYRRTKVTRLSPTKSTLRLNTDKFTKDKDRENSQGCKRKGANNTRAALTILLNEDFSAETLMDKEKMG